MQKVQRKSRTFGVYYIDLRPHCVYDIDNNRFINFSIDIIDENDNVVDTIYPRYAHVNKTFALTSSYSNLYDYALIYVDEDLSEYGAFNLGIALDQYVSDSGTAIVSGFPQTYPNGYADLPYGIRFRAIGNILPQYTNSLVLCYSTDMTNGDSGGPVYLEEGIMVNGSLQNYKTVIGINVSQNLYYNTGVRMTSDLLMFFCSNQYTYNIYE